MAVPYGVSSMVASLQHVLVQSPRHAFGDAFNDPAYGYLHPVNLDVAAKEHIGLCELLEALGVTVHNLASDAPFADMVYTYDPALITRDGAILLRPGKSERVGEEDVLGAWFEANGIPIVGRIEAPGTADGGDIFWLTDDILCVGRTLRTNQVGIDQLADMVSEKVHVFDVAYDAGPAECLHLLSTISMVREDLAVVDLKRLPAGLYS
ncbi:MAG: arginine deiminase, partial [Acidimicrobiia bacterium]|nr:arginine deiminase [Acidimicrobiia bacterium]